ncbi:hypothetical protein BJX61DRAFT_128654 [Aspergillus egyptiacus]|nr:hypothetical protein BJX61DRAFT_128654 [Aspergillus egyptiacus]
MTYHQRWIGRTPSDFCVQGCQIPYQDRITKSDSCAAGWKGKRNCRFRSHTTHFFCSVLGFLIGFMLIRRVDVTAASGRLVCRGDSQLTHIAPHICPINLPTTAPQPIRAATEVQLCQPTGNITHATLVHTAWAILLSVLNNWFYGRRLRQDRCRPERGHSRRRKNSRLLSEYSPRAR